MKQKQVLIIGGGVIGLTSAYYLCQSGHKVTVLDALDFETNCSTHNAGLLVPSHFIPMAEPGVIWQGLKWSLSPKSPFALTPNKSLLPWVLNFFKSSTQKHTENSYKALFNLNVQSKACYAELSKTLGFSMKSSGLTLFFKKQKSFDNEKKHLPKANALGIRVECFNEHELKAFEPDEKINAIGAVHYHCDASINPGEYLSALRKYLLEKGVVMIQNEKVREFEVIDCAIKSVQCDTKSYTADEIVISAGVQSMPLFNKLKLNIPVQPGKGYSFDNTQKLALKHPAILVDGRVAISLLNDATRISGTMEIGGNDKKVKPKKVEGLVEAVNAYFPKYAQYYPAKETVWVGHRPCSADGLPYIGRVDAYSNLLVATGHSMMGVSLAAITGKLINELVSSVSPSVDLKPFKPDRFM